MVEKQNEIFIVIVNRGRRHKIISDFERDWNYVDSIRSTIICFQKGKCFFKLRYVPDNGVRLIFRVKCSTHNHDLVDTIKGYLFPGNDVS